MCSKTVATENRKEMKTKEIHFSLFYFHFNYVVECHNATALVSDKQYCELREMNREMVKTGISYFRFFSKRINKIKKKQTKL